MIPDFKTYIGESLWSDLQNKSMGKSIRKEDDLAPAGKFHDDFLKILKMPLIYPKANWHLGVDYEWTPCNFGADDYDKPGLYLNSEEIVELNEYLKGTEYEIAGDLAFDILRNRHWEKKKIGDWWYYIFGRPGDESLYIGNFGVWPEDYTGKFIVPTKTTPFYYGHYYIEGAGYTQIYNSGKSLLTKSYVNSNQTEESDRFQVRLVKRIS